MSGFTLNEATGMKEFEISRARWARGGMDALLLDPGNGKMCCLGVFGRASELSDFALENRTDPWELGMPALEVSDYSWLVMVDEDEDMGLTNSEAADKAIRINDNRSLSEDDREAQLTILFNAHGYHPVFVD